MKRGSSEMNEWAASVADKASVQAINDIKIKYDVRRIYSKVILDECERLKNDVYESLIGQSKKANLAGVIQLVCDYYTIHPERIKDKSRERVVVDARYLIFWITYRKVFENRLTLQAIGNLTNQHHTTVLHGANSIDDRIEVETKFREDVIMLCKELGCRAIWKNNRLNLFR